MLVAVVAWTRWRERGAGGTALVGDLLPLALPSLPTLVLYVRFALGGDASLTELGLKTTVAAILLFPDHEFLAGLARGLPVADYRDILFALTPSLATLLYSMGLAAALLFSRRRGNDLRTLALVLAGNTAVFLVSPLVVWWPTVQVRYSLAVMPLPFILTALLAARVVEALLRRADPSPGMQVAVPVAGLQRAGLVLPLVILGLQAWTYSPKAGFPGYPGTYLTTEPTGIYRWVWEHVAGRRVYVSGAQPFGIYGRGLDNEICYSYNTDSAHGEGVERWTQGLAQTDADYFVYHRTHPDVLAPDPGPPREVQPFFDAPSLPSGMYLEPVFFDRAGAVFAVRRLAEEAGDH